MKKVKEEFEVKRVAFLQSFKKQKRMNSIILAITLALIVALLILGQGNPVMALTASVVAIVFLYVYTKTIKKKLNEKTMEYINYFYEKTSAFALTYAEIGEYKQFTNNEINIDDVNKAKIMKDITMVKSRNDIIFEFANKEIKMSDTLFKIGTTAQTSKIVFCGKFIQCELDQPVEGQIIIYRKPKGEFVGPNMVDDLEVIKDDEKSIVYASTSNHLEKYKKIINLVSKFEINDYLLDVTVSIVNDTLSIALSYSDSVMVVPLYDEMNVKPFEKCAKDLSDVKQIIETL